MEEGARAPVAAALLKLERSPLGESGHFAYVRKRLQGCFQRQKEIVGAAKFGF